MFNFHINIYVEIYLNKYICIFILIFIKKKKSLYIYIENKKQTNSNQNC
jgi:hypothetical protein